jgi:uncharacterized protein (TIGR00369 family)
MFMAKVFDESEYLNTGIKFLEHLGIRMYPSESKTDASGIIELKDHHSQIYEAAHGGVLYSLADTVAGHCVWNNIDHVHDMIITLEMKMNYVAACPIEGYIKAIANIKHIGKRTAVINIDVFHIKVDKNKIITKEKLVATAIATFQILKDVR